jgi:aconitate hydratase
MAENLTRQILREHLAEGELDVGSPIGVRVDQTLLQDATGTMAFMQFEQLGVPRVRVERAVQYIDHNVVQLDFKNPDDHRMLQAMARKYGAYFSRPGNGISHYISLERFAKPGQILVGADSHTTTSGALGMIAIGAGGLDVAVAMAGYPFEIACPAVVEVRLEGTLARPWVQAKDIILELLRRLSTSGGKNKVFEFTGPGTADLSIPERGTIANMIAELGATSAVFAPDAKTRDWLAIQQREDDFAELGAEDGCEFDERVEIDLGALGPLVAKPSNPDNVVPVEEVAGTELAQVCIGSSVNSGYFDLALPAAILADRAGRSSTPTSPPPRPPARGRSSGRSPSRACTASWWRAACACSSRCAGPAWAWARRRPATPTPCAPSTATSPGARGRPRTRSSSAPRRWRRCPWWRRSPSSPSAIATRSSARA